MSIISMYYFHRKPLKQASSEVTMDSWGLYSVTATAVVHDDDVVGDYEEYICELQLPPANYTATRRTIYYPGKTHILFFIL